MFEVVHELDARHDLRVAVHGCDQFAAEEVVETDVLVGAGRCEVRPRLVQLHTDEGALRAHRPTVTLLLLTIL